MVKWERQSKKVLVNGDQRISKVSTLYMPRRKTSSTVVKQPQGEWEGEIRRVICRTTPNLYTLSKYIQISRPRWGHARMNDGRRESVRSLTKTARRPHCTLPRGSDLGPHVLSSVQCISSSSENNEHPPSSVPYVPDLRVSDSGPSRHRSFTFSRNGFT
jgi:hypothetical protein